MTYPCSNCNRDEGSPICLGDARCQRVSPQARAEQIIALRRRHNSSGQDGADMANIIAALSATPFPNQP